MSKKVILEYDGASKGNPGRSGAGGVLKSESGAEIARFREGLGHGTNNAAEYAALNRGMKTALDMGYDQIHVRGDSQLVHNQVQGHWKTRNENMSRYCSEAQQLGSQFKSFDMEHVPRGYNTAADSEANKAVNLPPGHVETEGGPYGYGGRY
ncbi:uncharacterized protein A4U43_C04F2710 [Asparagus officinalis]|uniref:RNase H type-1 domain-containing protein n=1 Tax=Asparagus officinalis TaxID=4686 RepID=A0A5P1EZJ4_ASPOF|nr:uncharacterized protein LOC109836463 [Asparagus officinalis]ONK70903.1 uncharacterized protein A4U43_C04F2710 [Asparagus officinalis]